MTTQSGCGDFGGVRLTFANVLHVNGFGGLSGVELLLFGQPHGPASLPCGKCKERLRTPRQALHVSALQGEFDVQGVSRSWPSRGRRARKKCHPGPPKTARRTSGWCKGVGGLSRKSDCTIHPSCHRVLAHARHRKLELLRLQAPHGAAQLNQQAPHGPVTEPWRLAIRTRTARLERDLGLAPNVLSSSPLFSFWSPAEGRGVICRLRSVGVGAYMGGLGIWRFKRSEFLVQYSGFNGGPRGNRRDLQGTTRRPAVPKKLTVLLKAPCWR